MLPEVLGTIRPPYPTHRTEVTGRPEPHSILEPGHPADTAGWDSAVRVDVPSAQGATSVYSPSTFPSWGLEDATQRY